MTKRKLMNLLRSLVDRKTAKRIATTWARYSEKRTQTQADEIASTMLVLLAEQPSLSEKPRKLVCRADNAANNWELRARKRRSKLATGQRKFSYVDRTRLIADRNGRWAGIRDRLAKLDPEQRERIAPDADTLKMIYASNKELDRARRQWLSAERLNDQRRWFNAKYPQALGQNICPVVGSELNIVKRGRRAVTTLTLFYADFSQEIWTWKPATSHTVVRWYRHFESGETVELETGRDNNALVNWNSEVQTVDRLDYDNINYWSRKKPPKFASAPKWEQYGRYDPAAWSDWSAAADAHPRGYAPWESCETHGRTRQAKTCKPIRFRDSRIIQTVTIPGEWNRIVERQERDVDDASEWSDSSFRQFKRAADGAKPKPRMVRNRLQDCRYAAVG
jgi:hypothetical protein